MIRRLIIGVVFAKLAQTIANIGHVCLEPIKLSVCADPHLILEGCW